MQAESGVFMPIDYVILGQRIAAFRTKAQLSQDQLAMTVHVNRKHISKIEQGRSRPSFDLLVDIAKELKVSVNELLDNTYSPSALTQLNQLLDGCTPTEKEIILRNAETLKKILDELEIK